MSVDGRYFTWTLAAGEDLDDLTPGTGHIFKAVALDDAQIAQNGLEAGGILVYGGKSGEHVTLGWSGVMKFTAAEAIPKGCRLTVGQHGFFFRARPGTYVVGRCLDSAVSAGAVGTGCFDFSTITYMGHDENSGEDRQEGPLLLDPVLLPKGYAKCLGLEA